MKVWCVFRKGGFESDKLMAIFPTEQKANRACIFMNSATYGQDFKVEEWEVEE
jgi:hypothetical protein